MADIFINYRRDDAPGVAGRLFDHLASRYSRGQLFMDVDAMEPGIDFAKQLEVQISQCHAVIAVIGPHWLDARDQAGHRRRVGTTVPQRGNAGSPQRTEHSPFGASTHRGADGEELQRQRRRPIR